MPEEIELADSERDKTGSELDEPNDDGALVMDATEVGRLSDKTLLGTPVLVLIAVPDVELTVDDANEGMDDVQDEDKNELPLEVALELELFLEKGGIMGGDDEDNVVEVDEEVLMSTKTGGTAGGGQPGDRVCPQFDRRESSK